MMKLQMLKQTWTTSVVYLAKEAWEHLSKMLGGGGGSNLSVLNSHSDFLDPWTFLGSAHINAINRCLNERVEVAQGLIIRHSKDKVCLKEFIKGCNSCLRHAGNGLLVQDDVKLLNATPLFSNTEEEGLCRSNLLKKCLDARPHLRAYNERF